MEKCFICLNDFAGFTNAPGYDGFKVECFKCGRYDIVGTTVSNYENKKEFSEIQRSNLSKWVRNQNPAIPQLDSLRLGSLKKIPTPTVDEKAHLLLLHLSKMYPIAGKQLISLVELLNFTDYNMGQKIRISDTHSLIAKNVGFVEGLCAITNSEETKFIVNEYLINEKGFLKNDNNRYFITPKGWSYLSQNPFSIYETAFVAMSFDSKYDAFFENVIKRAIEKAGWKALRLKEERHNNYITSEIISGIKRSKFMIADFTENCEGAYFEAGFARGFGIPVIHMVHESYLNGKSPKKLHFDTLQIFHLAWNEKNFDKWAKYLFDHIVSTIGVGPNYIDN